MKNRHWLFFALLFCTITSQAKELTPESVKGIYHLGVPERGQQQVEIVYGDMKGKAVIAVAPCERCPPAVYSYLKKESGILGIPAFTTNGLYLFQYNDNSFVVAQPDVTLGERAWSKFKHTNIYSKDKATANSLSRSQIAQFAINISNRVMGENLGKMEHKTGIYYLAMPVVHIGNAISQYNIELLFDDRKEINITPCAKCSIHRYQHLSEESVTTGVDVYRYASGDYLFNIQEGVLVHVFANSSGLGKIEWGKKNHFNVFSNNQTYIRHLLTSAKKQTLIDKKLKGYFSAAKAKFNQPPKEAEQAIQKKQETIE